MSICATEGCYYLIMGGLFYFITEQGHSFNITTVCVDVFDTSNKV
jgi:hypothetical protein